MKGSCHCGDLSFEVRGPVRRASICRCGQCRRMSGGDWASATVAEGDLRLRGEPRWFRSSRTVRRGFCPRCGAFLLWAEEGSAEVAVALGAVDGPTGLRDLPSIFVPKPAAEEGPLRGSCLCGAVRVTVPSPPGPVTACHCIQCRKISGHVPRTIDDPARASRIEGPLAVFVSPGGARRSFCPNCGSKVSFDGPTGLLSLEAGLFDGLAARAPDIHIYAAWKGDYYDLPPGARIHAEGEQS